MNPVLGSITPDPIGDMLGTGYQRFSSPCGICGLAKEQNEGARLDLLAVDATKQGTGQFRAFIHACKEAYQTICVWEISIVFLEAALMRYGFKWIREVCSTGEVLTGRRWDRPTLDNPPGV